MGLQWRVKLQRILKELQVKKEFLVKIQRIFDFTELHAKMGLVQSCGVAGGWVVWWQAPSPICF